MCFIFALFALKQDVLFFIWNQSHFSPGTGDWGGSDMLEQTVHSHPIPTQSGPFFTVVL